MTRRTFEQPAVPTSITSSKGFRDIKLPRSNKGIHHASFQIIYSSSAVHVNFAQSDPTATESPGSSMQTEPTKSIDQEPSTNAPTPQQPTTQDGFRSPGPGSLDGSSQPGFCGPPSGRVPNGASPVLKGSNTDETGEEQRASVSREDRSTLPGERVSAYEHATTPSIPTGFKVTKRPSPTSEGPSLADCPNGVYSSHVLARSHFD